MFTNYINILLGVLVALTITEFMFSRHHKAQKQIFYIAFAFTAFWTGIKYYIGPDIALYVPMYDNVPPIRTILSGQYESQFEIGYVLFCSLLHNAGISFWLMTLIISTLYLSGIFLLFRKVTSHRTFALLVLAVFEYDIMLCQLRQCLAVGLIIYAFLAYEKKWHLASALLLCLSVFFHKSAVFFIVLALTSLFLLRMPVKKTSYILALITLLLFIAIPLNHLLLTICNSLSLPESMVKSITVHLELRNPIQGVLPIYLFGIVLLSYYYPGGRRISTHEIICWVSVAAIAILFQQFMLLDRLRSLFLPFLIPVAFNACLTSGRRDQMPRQVFAALFILYTGIHCFRLYQTDKASTSHCNRVSTVFATMKEDRRHIIERQMREASLFWKYDYTKKMGQQ